MINKTFLYKIKQKLDESKYFSSNDFSISEDYGTLKISYEYNEEFYLELTVPKESSKITKTQRQTGTIAYFGTTEQEVEYHAYKFSGRLSPGSISQIENYSYEGENSFISLINTWLDNLWNELTFAPELRKLNDIEIEIKIINEKFDNISEDYFTNNEIIHLSEKLEKLEQQFTEKLEQEIQDKENLKSTLADLHKEIEKLKGQSKVLNKKNWFKSFGGKIFGWISKEENRKFLKDIGDFIQPLLPNQ